MPHFRRYPIHSVVFSSNTMKKWRLLPLRYPELQETHIRAALAFAAERDTMTKVVAHETVA